jgi:hypothetical protein
VGFSTGIKVCAALADTHGCIALVCLGLMLQNPNANLES